MPGGKVFVSHDSADLDFIKNLQGSLNKLQITCYVSKLVRESGNPKKNIPKHIHESEYTIVYFSSKAKRSNWVNQEIGLAFYHLPDNMFILVDNYDDINDDGALLKNETAINVTEEGEENAIYDVISLLRGRIESPPIIERLELRFDCRDCDGANLHEIPHHVELEHLHTTDQYLAFECSLCGYENEFNPFTFQNAG